ncbi:hypothetical protein Tco_0968509 [Tanacetum coccineum]
MEVVEVVKVSVLLSRHELLFDIDANKDIYLVNVNIDEDMFGVNDLDGDEVIVDNVDVVKTTEEIVNAAATTVSTASTISVSAATTTTTTTVSDVEITLAQALTELKSAKPKVDKVMIEEPEQGTTITTLTTTTVATKITAASTRPKVKGIVIHEQEQAPTPTVSSQQPSQVKVQDKGKGKMVEPEPVNKMSKKDLLRLDEELAFKLQAKEEEEERLAREKAQQTEEVNIACDDVQAKIDADYQLSQRLQAQEQKELTDEEKARLNRSRIGINKWYQSFALRNFDLEVMEFESAHGNNEDTSSKAMLAIDGVGFDWSDMAEEQVQTNMALMAFSDSEVYNDKTCSKTCLKNYETLKKQCDDLIVKLNQTEFTATTYKRGLATLEEQLITYRKNEVLFSEEVAVLKREVACKDYEINVLKSEFEKVKQEKEGIEFKIEKFDKASKDLDKLLESQITDKSKKGLGYSVVPPPHPLIYNRPKKLDLSYSGLDEFKEPEFKGYGSEDSKKESNVVCDKKSDDSKENSDNSLVKEQVSKDTSSFVESSLNVDKETIFPVDKKVESVKPKNHEKPVKKSVRYAEMYRSQTPRGNQRNWNGQKSNQLGIKYHQGKDGYMGLIITCVELQLLLTNGNSPLNAQRNMVTRAVNARPKTVNTTRPKAVKTARPNSAVVNTVRVNQANAGKPQRIDTRFFECECSTAHDWERSNLSILRI